MAIAAVFEFPGEPVEVCRFSNAHCCLAPSTWRRLLMQAFCWAVVRARTKLGMAIAASNPMMATTIMISTSVKPALREMFFFIRLSLFLLRAARTKGPGGFGYVLLRLLVH